MAADADQIQIQVIGPEGNLAKGLHGVAGIKARGLFWRTSGTIRSKGAMWPSSLLTSITDTKTVSSGRPLRSSPDPALRRGGPDPIDGKSRFFQLGGRPSTEACS